MGYGVQGIPRLYGQLHERTGVTTITNFTNTPSGISVCIQIANTEEYIDGQLAGNLGEVLIRYGLISCSDVFIIATGFIHSHRMNIRVNDDFCYLQV